MKRLLLSTVVAVLGLALAATAQAGSYGCWNGSYGYGPPMNYGKPFWKGYTFTYHGSYCWKNTGVGVAVVPPVGGAVAPAVAGTPAPVGGAVAPAVAGTPAPVAGAAAPAAAVAPAPGR